MKTSRMSLLISAVIVLLDQISKAWALGVLADGHIIPVVWTMQFNLTYNRGMAFSRGTGIGPIIGVIGFLLG